MKSKIIFKFLAIFVSLYLLNGQVNAQTIEYDNLNRITSVTFENGEKIDYCYDLSGNILSIEKTFIAKKISNIPDDTVLIGGTAINIRYIFSSKSKKLIMDKLKESDSDIYCKISGQKKEWANIFQPDKIEDMNGIQKLIYYDELGNKSEYFDLP